MAIRGWHAYFQQQQLLLLFHNHYYDYYGYYYYQDIPAYCQGVQLDEGVHNITVNYFKRTNFSAKLEVYMDGSLIILNGKSHWQALLVNGSILALSWIGFEHRIVTVVWEALIAKGLREVLESRGRK